MMKKTNLFLIFGLLVGLIFNGIQGATAAGTNDSELSEDIVTISLQEPTLQLFLDQIRDFDLRFLSTPKATKKITVDSILLAMVLNYTPEGKDSFYQDYTNHLLTIDPFSMNNETSRYYLPYFQFLLKEGETIKNNIRYNLIQRSLLDTKVFFSEASVFFQTYGSFTKKLEQAEHETKRNKIFERISNIIKQFFAFKYNNAFGARLDQLLKHNPEECLRLLNTVLTTFDTFVTEAGPITFALYEAFSISKEEFLKTVADLKEAAIAHTPRIDHIFLSNSLNNQKTLLTQGIVPAQEPSVASQTREAASAAWEYFPDIEHYATEAAATLRNVAQEVYEASPNVGERAQQVLDAAKNAAKTVYDTVTGNRIEG
jgi:hypothetical protein